MGLCQRLYQEHMALVQALLRAHESGGGAHHRAHAAVMQSACALALAAARAKDDTNNTEGETPCPPS